jgi:fumarylacetoacetase
LILIDIFDTFCDTVLGFLYIITGHAAFYLFVILEHAMWNGVVGQLQVAKLLRPSTFDKIDLFVHFPEHYKHINTRLISMASWISYSADCHFPLENLPLGVFSTGDRHNRIGSAIGSQVADLCVMAERGLFSDLPFDVSVLKESTMNKFMALGRSDWRALRARLTSLFSSTGDATLRTDSNLQNDVLLSLADVKMHLPCVVGDYTDFYSSKEHATNVGTMIRGKDNAMQPNWLHLPVGYHGRSSSVVISGHDVVRPLGQVQKDKADASKGSDFAACRLLDFELEMAFFVGGAPNQTGRPLTLAEAEERIFGCAIMNDWSARDLQTWEYVPLGPFTSKNFLTAISPWIVSMDALEKFKCQTSAGEKQDPEPLPYLLDPNYHQSAYNIDLTVAIKPDGAAAASTICNSNLKYMYWNAKQQLTHHSISGCPMYAGDVFGTGTISGTSPEMFGCMLEQSWRGTKEIALENSPGETRKFLRDGDTVIMSGFAQGDGYRIGFGECTGKVLPAVTGYP